MNQTMKKRTLPLFPIQAVLFPGGVLSLPVIEARDLDIVAEVAKDDKALGVVLSEETRSGRPYWVEVRRILRGSGRSHESKTLIRMDRVN